MVARSRVLVVLVVAVLASAGFLAYQTLAPQGCRSPSSSTAARYQAGKTGFGAVTEYCLASPQRWANGIAVGPDGSVWFGEEALPGIAQLFSNGTVVEHAWPPATGPTPGIDGYRTGIWGIAIWRGLVWGTDGSGNAIRGYDPADGSFRTISLPNGASQPYTLTSGPDGALWFTTFTSVPTVGRISPNFTVSVYHVLTNRDEIPLEIQFVNSSLGYYAALDPFNGDRSGLYAFDPSNVTHGIASTQLGADVKIVYADSLSVTPSAVWVAQHLVSNIAGYNLTSKSWAFYPTSTVPFTDTTLPYFVRANGGTVWFNEHYANRIAALNPASGTLTEYSEADPPITNESNVQNDLTIADTANGLWFTSTTGNYVGFVNVERSPSFTISNDGNLVALAPGSSQTVQFRVSGNWSTSLKVQVSDSENYTSVPSLISIRPSISTIPAGSTASTISVTLSAKGSLQPGRYTVGVTVTDGLVWQTAYLFVTVA
jgi:streptogramin lyase